MHEIWPRVGPRELALAVARVRKPPFNTDRRELCTGGIESGAPATADASCVTIGVSWHVTSTILRHAYANRIARATDVRIAGHILGLTSR